MVSRVSAYIADIVTPNRVLFTIVPDFNIREWERTIEELLKLEFDRAVYSHNNLPDAQNGGTKQHATENLQFIRDLRAAIHAEFQKATIIGITPAVGRSSRMPAQKPLPMPMPMNG